MGADANIQALIPVWVLHPPVGDDPNWRFWHSDIRDVRVSVFGHVESGYADAEFFITMYRSGVRRLVRHVVNVPDDICTSAEKTKAFAIDQAIKFIETEEK